VYCKRDEFDCFQNPKPKTQNPKPKTIGVIGGMGPLATAKFYKEMGYGSMKVERTFS